MPPLACLPSSAEGNARHMQMRTNRTQASSQQKQATKGGQELHVPGWRHIFMPRYEL